MTPSSFLQHVMTGALDIAPLTGLKLLRWTIFKHSLNCFIASSVILHRNKFNNYAHVFELLFINNNLICI